VHLASLASPESDRWLPIFWGLDYFKDSQARDVSEGDWWMKPVDEESVPSAAEAQSALVEAMERWDVPATDVAAAGLARTGQLDRMYEPFYWLGARDFRSIGHKAIYVANSRRTLDSIDPAHAEPVIRSLAYALLMHEGDNPAKRDDPADRPGRQNQERAEKIRADWAKGESSEEAVAEMLRTIRTGSEESACDKVVELLNRGVAPQSIWDALFCGAGELLARQPGIVALHAVTSTNGIYYAWQATTSDRTRRLLLLQNAAFLPLFLQAMHGRGEVGDLEIDRLEPVPPTASGEAALGEVLADISGQPLRAASKLLGYLESGGSCEAFVEGARRLVLLKSRESHDYKFSSAALEDYAHLSTPWRNRYLATSVFKLFGPGHRDSDLVRRTRKALDS
jgi:hypothetical protein